MVLVIIIDFIVSVNEGGIVSVLFSVVDVDGDNFIVIIIFILNEFEDL